MLKFLYMEHEKDLLVFNIREIYLLFNLRDIDLLLI